MLPLLVVERVDLEVDPNQKLDEISAGTADRKGSTYVLHRPSGGDPAVDSIHSALLRFDKTEYLSTIETKTRCLSPGRFPLS